MGVCVGVGGGGAAAPEGGGGGGGGAGGALVGGAASAAARGIGEGASGRRPRRLWESGAAAEGGQAGVTKLATLEPLALEPLTARRPLSSLALLPLT